MSKTDSSRIIGKQLIRSVTSTAANYRAACLSRSKKEFYSKISIVVEEADETLFWLEILKDS
jgi:four helix bundle protein